MRCLLLLLIAVGGLACEEDFDLPAVAEFGKAERERLGELLRTAYLDRPGTTVVPRTEAFAPLYTYLDALYAQATNEYRLDSRATDRWTPGRSWALTVIADEAATLIAFPGGDVVLSTGLLRQLTEEYELYALLALEATLVQEGLLVEQLVDDYGIESLELIANASDASALRVFGNLAAAYPTLPLAAARLQRADPPAQALICRSSLYRPSGGVTHLEKFSEAAYYRIRPTYSDRPERLRNFAAAGCGTLRSNGGYAQYVLPYL